MADYVRLKPGFSCADDRDHLSGAGQSISVIDDFRQQMGTAQAQLRVTRRSMPTVSGYGEASFDVTYFIDRSLTHGNVVSSVTGGRGSGSQQQITIDVNAISASLLSCTAARCDQPPVYSFSLSDLWDAPSSSVSFVDMPGVSKDALVVNNQIDLSATQNLAATLSAMTGHMDNSSNAAAINISVEVPFRTVGTSFGQVRAQLSGGTFLTKKTGAVVVAAAGNGGAPCAEADLNGCNILAVAMALHPDTRESTIIAGALEGSGQNEQIASYSTRAGALADRYLLANGQTGDMLSTSSSLRLAR